MSSSDFAEALLKINYSFGRARKKKKENSKKKSESSQTSKGDKNGK